MASASQSSPTERGLRLGRYELVRWLGEGGFAEVWLARDVERDEHVAVKVMRRARARDLQNKRMFLDEALIASRIDHPNVAHVIELGEEDGTLFLAMQHVAGGSLEAMIEGAHALGEPIPPAIALRILADVCAGLHAAHELTIDGREQHVIHRDVSPQNVLLTERGVPKLIDFGIAKARERLAKETSTGVTKGKVSYMSPEQARGAELDRRADLWAMGALAYELFEGRRLLDGPNELARLQALVSKPIVAAFERTPPAAVPVLERAIAFQPNDRQATADELRRDFERVIAESGLVATYEEIAAFQRRALGAIDEPERPRLAPLLGVRPSDPTVSAVRPATTAASIEAVIPRRSLAPFAIGAVAVAVTGLVAALAFGIRRPAPSPLPAPAGSAVPASVVVMDPPPIAPSAIPSASTETPPPVVSAAPAVTPIRKVAKPAKTPTASAPRTRPNDDDQIE